MNLLNLLIEKCVVLYTKYYDYQVKRIVSGNPDQAWKKIKKLWGNAKIVYRGPTGFSAFTHVEYIALQEFISKYNTEVFLIEGLEENNPSIVGYCLEGLLLIKSPVFEKLPNSILQRQEKITSQIAFLKSTETLGHFASLYVEWYNMEKNRKTVCSFLPNKT